MLVFASFIHRFSSPKSYVEITRKFFPYISLFGFLLLLIGWIWGLAFAPEDAVQGNSYRIIYLHVPASLFAQLIYFFMSICALIHLVWRVKLAAYLIKSAALVGAMITFIALFSGSTKTKIMERVREPINRLIKYKFQTMFLEDKLYTALPNVNSWLLTNFNQLNHYAKKTHE